MKKIIEQELVKIKHYKSPVLIRTKLEIEVGIAVGSATTKPENNSGEVEEEWEIGEDRDNIMPW